MNQPRVLVTRRATFGAPWMSRWATGGFWMTKLPTVSRCAIELPFWHIKYTRRASCDRSIHSLFQSEFSTECFIFPLPGSSRFLKAIQSLLTSYSSSSRLFYLSFNNLFQKAVPTQDVTNPVILRSCTLCRIFLSSFTLCNSSFLTRSVQHHISTTSRSFWSHLL
jgi:hypothetical protein